MNRQPFEISSVYYCYSKKNIYLHYVILSFYYLEIHKFFWLAIWGLLKNTNFLQISNVYAGLNLSNCSLEEPIEEKWVDPVIHKEYMVWKKSPTLKKDSSKFLQRLFQEDLVPCLTFPNETLTLRVRKAVEDNSLCISPIKTTKSEPSDNERYGYEKKIIIWGTSGALLGISIYTWV